MNASVGNLDSSVRRHVASLTHRGHVSKSKPQTSEAMAGHLYNISVGFVAAVSKQMDVAEVYSPPRVTGMAERLGMRAGWSLDLATRDEEGNSWDFNKAEMKNKAARKLISDEPYVLIGSPPCTDWSSLMNLNWPRMTPEEVERRNKEARVHLEFCMKLYKIQHDHGRYFLHEHLDAARSWDEEAFAKIKQLEGTIAVQADQCRYGLKSHGGWRSGPAMMPTKFMTNSPCIAVELQQRCPNRVSHDRTRHEHVSLMNGRAKVAQ